MQRNSKVMTIAALIVLLVFITVSVTGWAQENTGAKSGKRKVSPTSTTHTIYLGYHHFMQGSYANSIPSPYIKNSESNDYVFATGLDLPANATITEFTFHAKMPYDYSSTDERLVMRLKYTANNGTIGTETSATVWGTYTPGVTWFVTKGRYVNIPVNNRPMYIWLTLPGTPDANDYEVAWVKVVYTTP